MYLLPTLYFRPLSQEIKVSYAFDINLRNPSKKELPIFQNNLRILSSQLSDKERRRILYTLYPLGIPNMASGSLEEIFIEKLSKIWIIASCQKELPFEEGLIDYGYLCGYVSDNSYLINPASFIADIKTITPRKIFRALKKELPKAAQAILNPNGFMEDLYELEEKTTQWDALLSSDNNEKYIQLAKTLRIADTTNHITTKFTYYCLALELLVAHNPTAGMSKMPINRQFSSKIALIRHIMIKWKDQNHINFPEKNYELYKEIYDIRSEILHGRNNIKIHNKKIAEYLNEMYPTLRLLMELQTQDPLLLEFIYNM